MASEADTDSVKKNMAQEKMDSWWEYAHELAKAERELKIEKWVYIYLIRSLGLLYNIRIVKHNMY